MKKLQGLAVMVCMIGLLTGCDNYSKQYDTNTLVVKGNGSIVEVSVEDFKGASVDAEGITSYVEEQIDTFNEGSDSKIKMKSIDTEDMSNVKLVLSYKDIDSFNAFNLLDYSFVDVADAKEADLTGSFTSSDDKKTSPSDIMAEDKGKVLTVTEATDVVVKGTIMYYNDEVTIKDGVAKTSGNKKAIIIFK
ncbi:MAG: hypothetical protein IJ661_12220 [Lachnospiraceae bacterium]|nr:hypothetical protein [Lachnospiraceae bacterium]